MSSKFFETVLRTEHLTEREWLDLLQERQLALGGLMEGAPLVRLGDFPCILGLDRTLASQSVAVETGRPVDEFGRNPYGIFKRVQPRSQANDCTAYIVGFTRDLIWVVVSIWAPRVVPGEGERVSRACLEHATPSHIVEMADTSYGELWFMLGYALEEWTRQRRDELVHLTLLEQRFRNENQIVTAIETDLSVTD
ncbi:hypothetical protein HZC53_00120 [Candidatus Uhrbacteria bacterium]|nr:hypothetical protein [Candidatus Uhrbacteria bacterium]